MEHQHIQSEDLRQIVVATRRRLRRNAVLCTVAAGVLGTVGWLLLASCIDLLVPLGVSLRVIAFIITLTIVTGLLIVGLAWFALRPMAVQRVAQRIEQTVPQMHNRLVTVLDLEQSDNGRDPLHHGFVERLIDQTRQRIADFKVEHVARTTLLRRLAAGAVVAVALGSLLMLLLSPRMPNAMARVLRPTAPIPPVSYVKIAPPGDMQKFQGEPVDIEATVERGEVETLTLRLIESDGRTSDYDMIRLDDKTFHYAITALNAPFRYQVIGGGTWTIPHQVSMLRRPILERLSATVILPDYMSIDTPQTVADEVDQISTPTGSRVELVAVVGGDVVAGQIQLFEPRTETTDNEIESETAWYDDDLPADAEMIGEWSWTTERAHSGTRSHTFGPMSAAYGFRTRLDRLLVQPDESFFVYVRLDPDDPPPQLIIGITVGEQDELELVWGESPTAMPTATPTPTPPTDEQSTPARMVHRGEMPPAGRWVQLTVPVQDLIGDTPAQPVKLSGMTFRIDRGRAHFDRAGTLRTTKQTVEKTAMSPTAMLPMALDERREAWTGSILVDGDMFYAVRFVNGLQHSSANMKPVRIVATTDQAPTLLVERPDPSITLQIAEPLPILLRAFDDYGVMNVSLRTGRDAENLGDERLVQQYDEPKRSRKLLMALDPRPYALQPGESLHYQLVVRDFNYQATQSPPRHLTLSQGGSAQEDGSVVRPVLFDSLLSGISKLMNLQQTITGSAGVLLSSVAPSEVVVVPGGPTVHLVNADGSPLTVAQLKRLFDKNRDNLTQEQQTRLAELEAQLAEQHRLALELSQQLHTAATTSKDSQLALPDESWVLAALGERLAAMAPLWDSAPPAAGSMTDQISVPLTSTAFEDMQSHLQQMIEARYTLATDPTRAQANMEQLLFDMRAKGAVHIMEELGDILREHQAETARLRERLEALGNRTRSAPGSDLQRVSNQQNVLDEDALERFRQQRAMLQARRSADFDTPSTMIAPWTPPGRTVNRAPAEQDTPEDLPPDTDERLTQKPQEDDQETPDWWDAPVDMGSMGQRGEMDQRFTGRQRAVAAGPDTDQTQPWTPRRLLQRHQHNLGRQLNDNSEQLGAALRSVASLRRRLEQALGDLNRGGAPLDFDAPGSGHQRLSQEAIGRMQRLLASQQMDNIMDLAQRTAAMRQSMLLATQAQHAMLTDRAYRTLWSGSRGGGYVIGLDLGDLDLSATQRAAVYRLPPQLRDPLIQAMKQDAPEGYQPLIDAYYRQLGTEDQGQ